MKQEKEEKRNKKGFFAKLIEKLDKKMADKAKSAPCCCKPNSSNKDSCCN